MTEQSEHSKAIIALGKKIVAELDLDNSVDTLGRWMAHHIAELIHNVENSTEANNLAQQTLLREAVLSLWAHRFELPRSIRPLGNLEKVLRVIETLDPESNSSRYFSTTRAPEDENIESETTRQWLDLAKRMDYASKALIDYCLTLAADSAIDQSCEWVELARDAGIDDDFDFTAIRLIKYRRDIMKEPNPSGHQRRILLDRKQKLEAFLLMAQTLVTELEIRLISTPPTTVNEEYEEDDQ